jgi:glycosyltransferase involved in cell wall biosynthesis
MDRGPGLGSSVSAFEPGAQASRLPRKKRSVISGRIVYVHPSMKPNRHALIFSTVWPEPRSSAAGVRQMQWIRLLLRDFEKVTVVSPAKVKGERDGCAQPPVQGLEFCPMPLNRWDQVGALRELAPELVMFDRFILEEQFGPMVYEALPEALCLLETQDLHFIRRAREAQRDTAWNVALGAASRRDFPLTETALRELAAIERVDHAFVVSSFEGSVLTENFGLGPEVHSWEPFFYDPAVLPDAGAEFEDRAGFVWIGNFRHAPNADALRWIRREIWPGIRERLPRAEFRIFGAYPSAEFMDWNRHSDSGIRVVGQVEELDQVFSGARVNLAPLRFGAGVKGKILEGFRRGVPVVTTAIGAEGLFPPEEEAGCFPGAIAGSVDEIIRESVQFHEAQDRWLEASRTGRDLMERFYDFEKREEGIRERIRSWLEARRAGRLPRWRSRVMRHGLQNGQKYFSKWIEEKERGLSRGPAGPS